ncbi:UDP-glucoronosyl and UDP-glucosyl transferase [Streptococcus gallolyticus]|uniref:UDP-glucoronosyl and UDP-glucosyl transferase n=1 Tax=Streptococcus gallolyticus TaxID=315405 RepID=A0AA94S8Z5_9STRE|nr:macrolide family glycosyltransferase [Streptococcus gallolyticus]AQP41318.1 macrolide glycosyltransferase [Streptococcus gallolyticus subsp. gallolyticus DSM 16831]SQG78600.1 UDP-glucoronosyl and UDP-glucosyl transferase [Streptococcus gallolyticus]
MGKRIIFMGVPAFGHTNPTLLLVKELINNGHQVRYYSVSNFRKTLEHIGAEVICYNDKLDYFTVEHVNQPVHNQKNHLTSLLSLISEAMDDVINTYLEDVRNYQPDVIVGDSLAFWAPVIAKRLEIPYVTSNTHFAFNEHTPSMMNSSVNFKTLLELPELLRNYEKIKKSGYPTKKLTDLAFTRGDCPVIVTTSKNFQPAGNTFGQNVHFVGPIIRESQTVLEKGNRPLIYISLGTVNNQAEKFYQQCFKALANKNVTVILSVGNKTDIETLGYIPDNFQVVHQVDQIAVLKIADVFLTHCGLNSTSEALYYQVPLLLFPQTDEQSIVADQVLQLGAGVKLDNIESDTIAQGINRLLTESTYKEQTIKISQDFKASGGVAKAMEIILDNCR